MTPRFVVAPDRLAPFAPIFDLAAANDDAMTVLAGRVEMPPLPELGAYALFLGNRFVGHEVVVSKTLQPMGGVVLYAIAIAPDQARVVVLAGGLRVPTTPEDVFISFASAERAKKSLTDLVLGLYSPGGLELVLAPLRDARAEDVYRMVAILGDTARAIPWAAYSSPSFVHAGIVRIVADRDGVTAEMHPAPPPPSVLHE